MHARTTIIAALSAVACCACGGGGGGGGAPTPAPAPVTPAPNNAPTVRRPIPSQVGIAGHSFRFDLTVDGGVFRDPDGDALSYSLQFQASTSFTAPFTSVVSLSGSTILGTLQGDGGVTINVTATDTHGASATMEFGFNIVPNSPPMVASPNRALLTTPGAFLSYDPTKGGSAMADPDGDRLTYSLAIVSPPRGLSVDGARVAGALTEMGLVTFELTARDDYGGENIDRFAVAIPAPEPGKPTLPATDLIYADEQLLLPPLFAAANATPRSVFWDTSDLNRPTNAGAKLGRVLFYDKRLSLTNTHSCGSCHHQDHGFASPERFNVGVQGVPLHRNAMALANARYNVDERWFADARAPSLEALALMPIEEQAELGNFLPLLEAKLAATDFYPPLFQAAFGTPEVTRDRIAKALGQFLRAIISYRSKFDRAVESGNYAAVLTPAELRGNNLFGSPDVRCLFCHKSEVHTLTDPLNNGLDLVITDPGLENGRFRAASLRNIAVTNPYMHDGRFATLREVIDHYDHGVQDSPLISNALRDSQNQPPRKLNLSEEDKQALEAFLRTFTDDEILSDPRFADPFVP